MDDFQRQSSEQLHDLLADTLRLLINAAPEQVPRGPWPLLLAAFMARGMYDLRAIYTLAEQQCGESSVAVARGFADVVVTASFISLNPERVAKEFINQGVLTRLWEARRLISVSPEIADRIDLTQFKAAAFAVSPDHSENGKMSWDYSFIDMAKAIGAPHLGPAYSTLSDITHGNVLSVARRFAQASTAHEFYAGPMWDYIWIAQYYGVVFGMQLCEVASSGWNLDLDGRIMSLMQRLESISKGTGNAAV